jgi:hypothetical protein
MVAGTVTMQVVREPQETAGSFIDATALPATGTYTIAVDPQGAVMGSLTLTVYAVPPDATATVTPGGAGVGIANAVPGQNMRLTFPGDPSGASR